MPLDRRNVLLIHNTHDLPAKIIHVEPEDAERLNRQILEFAFAEVYGHPEDIAQCSRKVLPRSDRAIGTVSGGLIEGVDMPDGINGTPQRRRPRPLRQTQDAGS